MKIHVSEKALDELDVYLTTQKERILRKSKELAIQRDRSNVVAITVRAADITNAIIEINIEDE